MRASTRRSPRVAPHTPQQSVPSPDGRCCRCRCRRCAQLRQLALTYEAYPLTLYATRALAGGACTSLERLELRGSWSGQVLLSGLAALFEGQLARLREVVLQREALVLDGGILAGYVEASPAHDAFAGAVAATRRLERGMLAAAAAAAVDEGRLLQRAGASQQRGCAFDPLQAMLRVQYALAEGDLRLEPGEAEALAGLQASQPVEPLLAALLALLKQELVVPWRGCSIRLLPGPQVPSFRRVFDYPEYGPE